MNENQNASDRNTSLDDLALTNQESSPGHNEFSPQGTYNPICDNASTKLTFEEFTEKIKAEIPRLLSATRNEPDYDPIIQDLMKINPTPVSPSEHEDDTAEDEVLETSIPEYSFQLAELLDFLLNQKLDDSSRMEYEANLAELLSTVPELLTERELRKFPDDHLSRILIDNFLLLLKLASLYFNLSLSSQVTKFIVKAIYKLECWEIYHLLQMTPDIEYFLKLVDIEVTTTPFGHIVKPPENLMSFNLRQGFQYPFPFPFYSFSYHTPDPYGSARKYAKISIDNYIDIRLRKTPKRRRRPRSWPKLPKAPENEHENRALISSEGLLHSPPILRSQGVAKVPGEPKDILKRHRNQKVYIFMEMSPAQIISEQEVYIQDREEEEEEYDTDEANAIMEEENETAQSRNPDEKFIIVSSAYERVLQDAEQKGIAKLTTLHQCRLLDPATQKPCLKIFYGRNELQRHQEFVHATTKKIYKCAYCEAAGNKRQSYPRHDSLARHIRRKHGVTGRENKMAVNLAKKHAEVLEILGPEPEAAAPEQTSSVEPSIGSAETRPATGSVSGAPSSKAISTSKTTQLAVQHESPQQSKLPAYMAQPPALAGVRKNFQYDLQLTNMYMPQQPYGTPMPMHGALSYPLPQYAKFSPWSVPPPQMMDSKMDVSRGPVMQGFQKFRFPNNYQPMAMQSAYGPMYGQEGMFYSVPLMQGQMPQPPYVRNIMPQPPQHLRQPLQGEQEQARQQQQSPVPKESPKQPPPQGLPSSSKE